MTPEQGTRLKASGIVLSIILYLSLALYTVIGKPSTEDVTSTVDRKVVALETMLKVIEKQLDENRVDHREINRKLDDIAKEIRK